MARRRRKSQDEETSYWLSYSDMMAAVLLVFVLIISFTMLQAKKQYEDRTKELEEKQRLIEEQQIVMEEQKKNLEEQNAIMEEQKKNLEEQNAIMEEQKTHLEDQQAVMEEQKSHMEKQQEQLDKIIGVKSDLIQILKKEFESTNLSVTVDSQTGAITFDSSILFDVNKYDLKESGKSFLEEFLPTYINVLLKKEYKDYISEIIIEGHTDTNGTYMHNLQLSQDRALSVATFCLDENSIGLSNEDKENLRSMLTANGKSFSDPKYNKDGSVNMDASRRVEFKFRLKDEEMVNEMMNILNH